MEERAEKTERQERQRQARAHKLAKDLEQKRQRHVEKLAKREARIQAKEARTRERKGQDSKSSSHTPGACKCNPKSSLCTEESLAEGVGKRKKTKSTKGVKYQQNQSLKEDSIRLRVNSRGRVIKPILRL